MCVCVSGQVLTPVSTSYRDAFFREGPLCIIIIETANFRR